MSPRPTASYAAAPVSQLLANDACAVMVTGSGSGYFHWRGLAVTRWREDANGDHWGHYIYLRDVHGGDVWSPTIQPLCRDAAHCETHFADHLVRFAHRNNMLTATLEITIDPRHDMEVRRLTLRNDGPDTREIELTSYAELVLGSASADASHPAFSKMFVQTEWVGDDGVLLATRRKREASDPDVWAAQILVVDEHGMGEIQYETDRLRFIGRNRGLHCPQALNGADPLSSTVGAVLDPIFSLRRSVRIKAGETARMAWVTLIADSRAKVLAMAREHGNADACEAVFQRARERAPAVLRQLAVDTTQARSFQRLASALLYADAGMRPAQAVLAAGEGGAPVLWARGISGDLPIVLLRVDSTGQRPRVEELLLAQTYLRAKHLPLDLVILNEAEGENTAGLQEALEPAIDAVEKKDGRADKDNKQGSVFMLRADQIDASLRNGLLTVARAVFSGKDDALARGSEDTGPVREDEDAGRSPNRARHAATNASEAAATRHDSLRHFNGLGGFSDDGMEYVTVLGEGRDTPMPWSHVVANEDFGFLVTTTGGGYSWSLNSQQNPLTPWSNDPVIDAPGEVLYLRDEDDGELWSATAAPIRVPATTYTARFGPGYAKFRHAAHGIESELLQFVPLSDSLKISRLTLRNRSGRSRRISITAYVEWALGAIGTTPAPTTVTRHDKETDSLFARNAWRDEFGERVAFAHLAGRAVTMTGDRGEFLGRNATLDDPLALRHGGELSGRVGAGFDPCAALRTTVELPRDASIEIVFLLGQHADEDGARALIARYRQADPDTSFADVETFWHDTLGTVKVRTPELSMDLLLNRCLLYQTLACRLWARTAFYQASGAYGFRDQLQDVMALCIARPELAREHILRAAGRQFVEGDVQHWWLPPGGKGVRTRVTDDRLWLPYVVSHYLQTTGDSSVLDDALPFLDGDKLKPEQGEAFFKPSTSQQTGSVFEHCARALEASLAFGAHGLPLMGAGDWNDGMNRVGQDGRGESVWLAWFLYAALNGFAPCAEARGEVERADAWREHARHLRDAIDASAWDGKWYLRAWYDDGTPLGSSGAEACMIDSIAQSWGVISGAADAGRAQRAMQSVHEHLVRPDDGLVALFTPPFDQGNQDPGYIKGYPPGLRENGGQYTHGSIWSAVAFAMLGDGDKAYELFRLFDPILHSDTPCGVQRYKVEPHAVSADVYSVDPHVGRGGWTWYTGSAGWLYRAGLESILGFKLRGARLSIDPCIPGAWPGFSIAFRYRASHYDIEIQNPQDVCRGVSMVELDGDELKDPGAAIPLVDDGGSHRIKVVLGKF